MGGKEMVTYVTLKLNSYFQKEIEVSGDLPIVSPEIIVPGSGYSIALKGEWVCDKCHQHINQRNANSFGVGGLECWCSSWEAPISMMSGTAHLSFGLRLVERWTEETKKRKALEARGISGSLGDMNG
jgi:hypothetical protein